MAAFLAQNMSLKRLTDGAFVASHCNSSITKNEECVSKGTRGLGRQYAYRKRMTHTMTSNLCI
jgi:hypothetical protein